VNYWIHSLILISHSWTILSSDPEARSRPSDEKATAPTKFEWPSSVCKKGFQFFSIIGSFLIQIGIWSENIFRIIFFVGVKMRAELYIWRSAISITDLWSRINRLPLCTIECNSVCLLDLILLKLTFEIISASVLRDVGGFRRGRGRISSKRFL
jgi:hypothetical protein